MVREEQYKDMKIYVCGICNFGYKYNNTAKECENFCEQHNSCSIEITKQAIKRG